METKKKDKRNKAEKANKMDIKKMTALAMFSVIALTIFTAESMIGPIVPIPGIKLVMSLISVLLKKKFLVLISMCGAAAHNIGQILAAIVITHSISVVAYLPVLMLSAMITGCFTGLAAQVCAKRLQRILKIYFT